MNAKIFTAVVLISAALSWPAVAQTYDTNGDYVQTFVGSGFSGLFNGQGTLTMFSDPSTLVADSFGNLYVCDIGNGVIRKITTNGTVSTFAAGGPLSFIAPITPMAIDSSNTIWTLAFGPLLHIDTNGYVSIVTDALPLPDKYATGLCFDSSNNLYLSDSGANQIYRYHPASGIFEVFVGSGNTGSANGNGIFTSFNNPEALACDASDNVYVWDAGNGLIRRINQNRDVTTVAGPGSNNSAQSDGFGTNASFYSIFAMCADNSGGIILSCYGPGCAIRRLSASGNVTTLAGSFSESGYTNGPGDVALFGAPYGVCFSGGTIYVADYSNQRIRSITGSPISQVVSPASLQLSIYPVLSITGTVGSAYQVQTSPDMITWTMQATLVLNSSPFLWVDLNPASGNKFYRALLLP